MMGELSEPQGSPLVAEVAHLLSRLALLVPQGAYLQSGAVQILAAPYISDRAHLFDLPITIWVAAGQEYLHGLPLVIQQRDQPTTVWYGRIAQRGKSMFRRLPTGIYQARIITPVPTKQTAFAAQTPIAHLVAPPLPLLRSVAPMGAHAERQWEYVAHDARGIFTANLHEERLSGALELSIETSDRALDGAIVCIRWHPMASGDARAATVQELLLPLAWSDALKMVVAHVSLGVFSGNGFLQLPETALQPAALTSELTRLIPLSVAAATRRHTRRAWERLLQPGMGLVADGYAILEATLRA